MSNVDWHTDFSKPQNAECQENKTNNVDEMRRLAGTLLGYAWIRDPTH